VHSNGRDSFEKDCCEAIAFVSTLTRADTVVYSVLVDEWPEARTRLQNLIDQRTVNEH
jgi:hypothetical protein